MINKLIMSSSSKIKVSQLSKLLHIRLADQGYINFYEYISEGKEFITRQAIHEYLRAWKRANPLAASYIEKGEDKAISYMMPAIGDARWRVDAINEMWEIDESPLDMMTLDENGKHVRAKLLNVIDVYSSRTVMTIAREGDSYAVMRLLVKAIEKFAKPATIKGDNGKNFLSAHVQGALANMGINYEATPAYQGWSKPFAERIFKKIQHSLVESLPGYIGHNVGERMDIEASVSKKDRRSKGKTNLTNLISLIDAQNLIDNYIEYIHNFETNSNLKDTPINIWNKSLESTEIQSIDMHILNANLGKAFTRKVIKKGVSMNGYKYFCLAMFDYREVKVVEDLSNKAQVYVYDINNNFIDIGISIDAQAVTYEQARAVQKAFKRQLNDVKRVIAHAREAGQPQKVKDFENIKDFMGEAQWLALEKAKPTKVIRNEDIENAKARLVARNTAPSAETMAAFEKTRHKEEPKKIIGYRELIEIEYEKKKAQS